MITVMGATGKVGGEITRQLLARGEDVRALGRSEARLGALAGLGASTLAGDAADSDYLTQAFTGAAAVFTLLPYDPSVRDYHAQQAAIGEAVVAAIRSCGVRHVVALSSVGADVPEGTGFLGSLYAQEQRLRSLNDVEVLVLRPGSFFENFEEVLDVILEHGVYGDAMDPDVRIPMIATRDVAAVAAEALVSRDWRGMTVRELAGPRDLSYADALRLLGEGLARPDLRYVRLPDSEVMELLRGVGFSDDSAHQHVEMARALSEGRARAHDPRDGRNATPTTFEDFAAALTYAAAGRATG